MVSIPTLLQSFTGNASHKTNCLFGVDDLRSCHMYLSESMQNKILHLRYFWKVISMFWRLGEGEQSARVVEDPQSGEHTEGHQSQVGQGWGLGPKHIPTPLWNCIGPDHSVSSISISRDLWRQSGSMSASAWLSRIWYSTGNHVINYICLENWNTIK